MGNNYDDIFYSSPRDQYRTHKEAIHKAIHSVLDSGIYINGAEGKAFESEFAKWVGSRHAISVANGTDAIRLALSAGGVGAGHEVITVSHTAVATVAAIGLCGAVPVFVDVDPRTWTIDVSQLPAAVSPKTRAVVAVHLYGNPANVDELAAFCEKRSLILIEDCAQSTGAKVRGKKTGTFGDFGCFSFYPTKNLGGLGDAGMIVTDEDEWAEKCRMLKQYGWKGSAISEVEGMNSRMDEIQAAILRVKLPHLERENARRCEIAEQYSSRLADLPLRFQFVPEGNEHAYYLFVIRTEKRDKLLEDLKKSGIHAGIHYPTPVHRQAAYLYRARRELLETEKLSTEILSLPTYPELRPEQVTQVVEAIRRSFKSPY